MKYTKQKLEDRKLYPDEFYSEEDMDYSSVPSQKGTELDKHSNSIFGKKFNSIPDTDKLKLMLEMERIKKSLGMKVPNTDI